MSLARDYLSFMLKKILCYTQTRNVDSKQFLGELPTFVSTVLEKIASFPGVKDCATRLVDQLTVSVYMHIPTILSVVSFAKGGTNNSYSCLGPLAE